MGLRDLVISLKNMGKWVIHNDEGSGSSDNGSMSYRIIWSNILLNRDNLSMLIILLVIYTVHRVFHIMAK